MRVPVCVPVCADPVWDGRREFEAGLGVGVEVAVAATDADETDASEADATADCDSRDSDASEAENAEQTGSVRITLSLQGRKQVTGSVRRSELGPTATSWHAGARTVARPGLSTPGRRSTTSTK